MSDNAETNQFPSDAAPLAWCRPRGTFLAFARFGADRGACNQLHKIDACDERRPKLAIGRADRKNAVPTAKDPAERSLAVGQLLDSKGSERTERTERKNAG